MSLEHLKEALIKISLHPAENSPYIWQYLQDSLATEKPMTFFSWKMFKTSKPGNEEVIVDYGFDEEEAERYVESEKRFLEVLKTFKVPFVYLKLVPDELAKVFWGVEDVSSSQEFVKLVANYFNTVHQPTQVLLLSALIAQYRLQGFYDQNYQEVYQSFSPEGNSPLVDSTKYREEIARRRQYHQLPLEAEGVAEELAKKAFALFAAETNVLWQLTFLGALPKLVMLAGARSVDTYKHEFMKKPSDRPILPKLFVI